MAKATCPGCEGGIRLERRLRMGQRFLCPHCCTVIEVISVAPLELDWAYDSTDEEEVSFEDVWSKRLGSARSLSW